MISPAKNTSLPKVEELLEQSPQIKTEVQCQNQILVDTWVNECLAEDIELVGQESVSEQIMVKSQNDLFTSLLTLG